MLQRRCRIWKITKIDLHSDLQFEKLLNFWKKNNNFFKKELTVLSNQMVLHSQEIDGL